MTQKVEAIYIDGVLKPTRELPLRDKQRVRLTVETIDEPERDREAAIARLKAGIASMRFFSGDRFPAERNCTIAVDTNVLIYACDQADPRRQKIALDLITNAQDGVLLWQVACEFLSASRKLSKQGFTPTDAWNRLAEFQDLLPLVLPTDANLVRAKALNLVRGASLWDALILAACVEAGVETFYSEDLPGFDDFEGVQIVNPFK